MRKAGFALGAGGVALVVSAFLPWISALDVAQARPSAGGVLLLLAVGAGTVLLGSKVLRNRSNKAIRATLWSLSAIETLIVLVFFEALHAANNASIGGVVSVGSVVRPAIGIYMAAFAVVTTIAGTILLQAAKPVGATARQTLNHRQPGPISFSATSVAPLSPDATRTQLAKSVSGLWWDGTQLRDGGDRG